MLPHPDRAARINLVANLDPRSPPCANWYKPQSLPAAFALVRRRRSDRWTCPSRCACPPGHKMAMKAVGVGELTYECRAKANDATAYEWVFVGPVAKLMDASNKEVGKYYAGPTWESADGSKVTGKQVAVAPATPGSIPLQLVKAEPATGAGAMSGRDLHPAREHQGRRRACRSVHGVLGRHEEAGRLPGGLHLLQDVAALAHRACVDALDAGACEGSIPALPSRRSLRCRSVRCAPSSPSRPR